MHPCIHSEMLIEHLLSSKPCDWNWGLSSDPSKCALCPLRAYGLVEEAGISPITHQLTNTWKLSYVPENKVVQCSESSLGGEGADLNMGSGQLLEKVTMDLRSKWWAGLKRESGEGKAFQTEGTACAKTVGGKNVVITGVFATHRSPKLTSLFLKQKMAREISSKRN